VTGTDFSAPAIRLARAMEPRGTFVAGTIDDLPSGDPFDLITLFDVLEHIPTGQRGGLFASLDRRLAPTGWIVLSTPHPGFTRRLHAEHPELLQVIDEPVEPGDVITLAKGIGRELARYVTYDVDWPGSRQYQLFALAPQASVGSELYRYAPAHQLKAKVLSAANPIGRRLRPVPVALRLARRGHWRAARWALGHDVPRPG
jgi:SAM-dependent methyltransferase